MTIHAVLLNWNQEKDVDQLLRRLLSWNDPALQIWVVDNASSDQELGPIAQHGNNIHLLQNKQNLGYAGGINTALIAIRNSAGENDRILLLNNDIEIEPECVNKLSLALDTHPKAGIAGPILIEGSEQNPKRSWGGREIGSHVYSRMPNAPATPPDDGCYTVDYVPGTVLLLKACLLKSVGLLDQDYFFSGEVADYAARAAQKGHVSIICSKTEAKHFSGDDSSHRSTLYRYYSLRNRFLYCRKHHADKKLVKYITWTIIGAAMSASYLLRGDLPAARCTRLAVIDGWKGRFGNQNERIRS